MPRYDNIQLLRLLAASSVVLYHLGCYAPRLAGVDPAQLREGIIVGFPVPLFFAVSGFVLTHAIRSAPPGRFLVARFLRLYPGYWLALLVTVGLMRLRLYTEYDRWLIHFVNLTEIALWPAGPDRCPYLLTVEWSLIYEVFLSAALAALSLFGTRRGLAIAAGAWLAVIGVKVAAWPGFATDIVPHWSTIPLSACNVPFLLGVLAYFVREKGRRWRWVVAAAVAVSLVEVPKLYSTLELHWCNAGAAAAGVVWLTAQFRQVSPRNPLARAGDWTYGLYLLHVPLMLLVFHAAARAGWSGHTEVVWLAGAVALAGGLLFGKLESTVHSRLRPLAKLTLPDLRARVTRVVRRGRVPA